MPKIRDCLYEDKTRHGTLRYRFRKDRDAPRITLPGKPGEPAFEDAYRKLMSGQDIRKPAVQRPTSRYQPGTFGDLADLYFRRMDELIDNKKLAAATYQQRVNLIGRVMPKLKDGQMQTLDARHIRVVMQEFRDTPFQANNLLKSLRAMFKFGVEIGYLATDPSADVKGNSKITDGFRPWTVEEVRSFFKKHPLGSKAHLALSLLIITACRRSDLVLLGPGHIQSIDGKPYLAFVQEKTGFQDRTKVVVPLVDSLARAISATTTGEKTFLITDYGKPFSKNGFGNRFRSWCRDAGLPDDLSSHGIRKAVGAILAEAGCTQYEIMALHGHGDPKASEIYTRSVDRRKLVESAMGRIDLGTIIG